MTSLWLDLKQALRMLLRAPAFAAMTMATLALGIGAATSLFSVLNGVLLKPLPYRDPSRLVAIFETNAQTDAFTTSEPNYRDMRAWTRTLEDVGAVRGDWRNLVSDGDPRRLTVGAASANLFQLLGVHPSLGSAFTEEDDLPGQPTHRLLLTDKLWRARFAADPNIVGHTVQLDDQSFTIVGVLPPRFEFPGGVDAYAPLGANTTQLRANHLLQAFARLKPGVTLAQARADMNGVAQRLGALYPESNRNWGIRLQDLRESIVGPPVARTVWVLWSAVMLLLVMACVNVANLLMARAATRQHEITMRVALGASRGRIMAQLCVESLPLCVGGCALGVLLASLGVDLLQRLGGDNIPRLDEIVVDGRVLAFALAAAAASAIVFGLAPALQLSRELRPAGVRTTAGRARRRVIETLVAAQVALALVLLVGAGLMLKSFVALTRVNPGFRSDHVLEVGIALSRTAYTPEQMFNLYRTVERELGSLPGVDAAGAISIPPESTDGNTYTRFIVSNRPQRDEEFLMANWRSVTGGFFRALAIPLLSGRQLTDDDFDVAARVALVNRAAAERFWPGQDPLGKIVTPYARKELNYTVVGVVGDVRDIQLNTPPDATVYLTGRAWPTMTFMLHGKGAPLALVPSVRERMRAINANLPLTVSTLDQTVSASLGQPRFAGTMLGIFSAVALLLAMMGIFSVTSFSVAQRTREIGIRMALGAQPSEVLRMLMWRGVALAAVGLAVGACAALASTRLLASLLFAVGATDPAVFAAVTLTLGAVGACATFVAARRATLIDPMVALRED